MPATDADLDVFLRLERQVWEALCAGDPEADARLLAPDFLGVYPTGFADRSEHAAQLNAGPTVASYELHEARLFTLTPDDVMLCYRADWTRTRTDRRESMYISSLWSRRGGEWLNVFSQDTPQAASVRDDEAR